MAKPAIVAVDDDPQVLSAVARDLRTRYGEDYRIVRASSASPTSTTSTTVAAASPIDEDAVVLQADVVGGCFMMGPNCVRYVVYGDASLEVYRLGGTEPELVGTGTVDLVLVSDLWHEIVQTDMEVLRSRLGPGQCQACVDGVDTDLVLSADGQAWVFNSADVGFDPGERIFALVDLVIRDASAQVDMEILIR